MGEKEVIKIISNALLKSKEINNVVHIFNGKGLQIETTKKRHYNIMIKDIDLSKGHIINKNK